MIALIEGEVMMHDAVDFGNAVRQQYIPRHSEVTRSKKDLEDKIPEVAVSSEKSALPVESSDTLCQTPSTTQNL